MEKIKDNIYVETEYLGCNPSFVVTSNGIVMIDTPGQKPVEALEWKERIAKHGDVTYIINTNHHLDHSVGNYFFSGDIIVHEGTMKRFLAEDRIEACKNFVKLIGPPSRFLAEIMEEGYYFVRRPKFTYTDKMNIYLGGEVFELIHIRAHTGNETIIYMPQKKVLFAGDNVCTSGIPNLSESYPLEWLEALKYMEEMDIEVLIPGHGNIGNKDSIKQFRMDLNSLLNRVRKKIDEGFMRDDIIKEVSFKDTVHGAYPAGFSERFNNHIKDGIGRLYDALIKK